MSRKLKDKCRVCFKIIEVSLFRPFYKILLISSLHGLQLETSRSTVFQFNCGTVNRWDSTKIGFLHFIQTIDEARTSLVRTITLKIDEMI